MTRYLTIFILLLLVSPATSFAQEHDLDKLLQELPVAKKDTQQVRLLLDIQAQYLDVENDSALYFNQKAEALIHELRADQFRYECYHAFVRIYHAKFDNPKAINYCLKALQVATANHNDLQRANSYRALFSLYFNVRKRDSALKYAAYAIDLTERIKDTNNLGTMYGNLCRIYQQMEMYDKAVELGKKGVELGERYHDTKGMLISMNNLANTYLSQSRYAEARTILEQLLEDGKKYKRMRSVTNALVNLSNVYYFMADTVNLKRVVTQMKALEPSFDKSDSGSIIYRKLAYGRDLMLRKQFSEAKILFADAINLAERDSAESALESLYLAMSTLHYAMQDFKTANVYDDKFASLEQRINWAKLREVSLDLETKYETEKKEERIKLQASQIKQERTITYLLAGGFLLLLIASTFAYRAFRTRQKLQKQRIAELETEKQLSATEAVLRGEAQERSRLAKDLHDGLGGMLSGIKHSFTTMKGNLIMTPDNARLFERSMDMLDTSIKEMRRVAHNMMPEALVKFGLNIALKDFCKDMELSGALQVTYQSFGVEDDTVIDRSTAITIYRIVQALVNNIVKHAGASQALVQLNKTSEKLLLTVEDNGRGFDTSQIGSGDGIGWTNIRHRVDYLKGTMDVRSSAEDGTSVVIELSVLPSNP